MPIPKASPDTVQPSLFDARIDSIMHRHPVTLPLDATVRQAIETMVEKKIGSIVVTNGAGVARGIFTQNDVVRRVAYPRLAEKTALEMAMSPRPVTLPLDATAYDAVLAMAEHRIRHLVVVDHDGRVCGMVSERDLARLHRVDLRTIARRIDSATTMDDLVEAAADVRKLSFMLMEQGLRAEKLTQLISGYNDRLTRGLIALIESQHVLPEVPWAWLAFGSEGREEQTFSTDQDNGIVFACEPGQVAQLRPNFLAFAADVNAGLAKMGFPLCKGNIMASNPQWCLSLDEWQACFSGWVRTPAAQALLNATIFFDFRSLYGAAELAERMHVHLLGLARGDMAFLRMLANNALAVVPPLGVFRGFVTEKDAAGKAYIDLKTYGSRIFVDVARVFALANGFDAASTTQRLRLARDVPGGSGSDVESIIDAFNYMQRLRLKHQHAEAGKGGNGGNGSNGNSEGDGGNRIYVGRLNTLERKFLKEACLQARNLQVKLKVNYQL